MPKAVRRRRRLERLQSTPKQLDQPKQKDRKSTGNPLHQLIRRRLLMDVEICTSTMQTCCAVSQEEDPKVGQEEVNSRPGRWTGQEEEEGSTMTCHTRPEPVTIRGESVTKKKKRKRKG